MAKKPVNKKPFIKQGRVEKPSFATNNFEIPADIKADIEKRGLAAKYVNIKQIRDFGGQHRRGWVPYKMSDDLLKSRKNSIMGTDPDGFHRMGDLVLAVKNKEDAAHHRAWLNQEAEEARVGNFKKRQYQKAKEYIKDAGLEDAVTVLTGYEENS